MAIGHELTLRRAFFHSLSTPIALQVKGPLSSRCPPVLIVCIDTPGFRMAPGEKLFRGTMTRGRHFNIGGLFGRLHIVGKKNAGFQKANSMLIQIRSGPFGGRVRLNYRASQGVWERERVPPEGNQRMDNEMRGLLWCMEGSMCHWQQDCKENPYNWNTIVILIYKHSFIHLSIIKLFEYYQLDLIFMFWWRQRL